ncbi:hydroxymethylglutaryl-CoA lyase [Lysinibacillus sp. BW-2-10]|uniref:hydroxymethylglutaryl-CoA lyase n=1 Tax=Lysinibacillus sp. BW-2-10 TaxID=2590030 RepID=UPI0011803661|nr:hydroxymethylglutaryl-CoA lyase [Lysinibacillus sp. BW-2-10]TSI02637.1 hydroxymethylglutaryl-CoA lyase [Lysinibacillus sp. BW-2-10]
MIFPKEVEIIEVGPRDGLQNESVFVPTDKKKELVRKLSKMGVRRIETASFVHPKAVPQMADAVELATFSNELGIDYIALTPNMKALARAIDCNVPQIAVFVGATETFNQRNIRSSIADSLGECTLVFKKAKACNMKIRAYVSMGFSCPYEGTVAYEQVARVVRHFVNIGADEISIGDTNGKANPRIVYERFSRMKHDFPETQFIAHFHDTNQFAYANVLAALQAGITKFDSSIAGLGGCPFSPGATGNVSTEGLVKLFHEMNIETGMDEKAMMDAATFAKDLLQQLKS